MPAQPEASAIRATLASTPHQGPSTAKECQRRHTEDQTPVPPSTDAVARNCFRIIHHPTTAATSTGDAKNNPREHPNKIFNSRSGCGYVSPMYPCCCINENEFGS